MDNAFGGTHEDASKVLDLALNGGIREQTTHELQLSTLLAAQASQIQDLRERVARLELSVG